VDGGLEREMFEAQALLADAYLLAGQAEDARSIAEDLVARDPADPAHAARLRRARELLGLDESKRPESVEIDLTGVLGELDRPAPATAPPLVPPRSLDRVFEGLRHDAELDGSDDESAEHLNLARTYLEMGIPGDAADALEVAARSPRHRFIAAAMLAQIHRENSDLAKAIEWFERAAEAPAPTPEEGRRLLYDLGDVLETVGEAARALAVFLELQTDDPGYRDVRERVTRLSKVETEG
jgi:tetratricopeptide (TPR) repeat protein